MVRELDLKKGPVDIGVRSTGRRAAAGLGLGISMASVQETHVGDRQHAPRHWSVVDRARGLKLVETADAQPA